MQHPSSPVKAAAMKVLEKFKTTISFELQEVTNLHSVIVLTILIQ
jgi:hypothetical protein